MQVKIDNCPVVYPSLKSFVQMLDREYKPKWGMVKVKYFDYSHRVVPPPQWKTRRDDLQIDLKGLIIHTPIQQNVFGKAGVYQCLHFAKKSITFDQYKSRSIQTDKKNQKLSPQTIQDLFWKNIAFSPPLYGADLLKTLMDETAGSWNLNDLDSILKQSLNTRVKGVNSSYCYIGCWKSFFCWHTQDLDLSAINYVHQGRSKFWYAVHKDDRHYLQQEARRFFPERASKCSQFLRHKTTLINPYILKRKFPQLRIVKTEHKANQFVIVFGGSYHTGFNFGFNIAQAVNYATLDWLSQIFAASSCGCSKSSVKVSLVEVLKNLQNSSIKNTKQWVSFKQRAVLRIDQQKKKLKMEQQKKRNRIEYNQQQDQNITNQFQVKSALSRKIKKMKKCPKSLKIKDQEYVIQNWIQCDQCKQWRKICKKSSGKKQFSCKQIGKKCGLKQKMNKNLLTL